MPSAVWKYSLSTKPEPYEIALTGRLVQWLGVTSTEREGLLLFVLIDPARPAEFRRLRVVPTYDSAELDGWTYLGSALVKTVHWHVFADIVRREAGHAA